MKPKADSLKQWIDDPLAKGPGKKNSNYQCQKWELLSLQFYRY